MFDGVPVQILATVSPWFVTVTIVLVVTRLIYTGALIPRSTYLDRRAEQEKFVTSLREALEEERETNRELMALVRELQAPSAKAVDILETVQEVNRGRDSGSG